MNTTQTIYHEFPAADYIDLVPFQYGREFCKPGHSFGPAVRNHHLFHYVISGRGELLVQDEEGNVVSRHEVHGGQGFMIFPGMVTTYIADSEDPWVYTWVEFDGTSVEAMLAIAGITSSAPIYNPVLEDLRATVEQEILFISTHPEAPSLQLIGHLYLFFDALLRSSAPARDGSLGSVQNIHVRSAIEYIERSFDKDISVADVAKSVGLNPSYFGKVFKDETGKTPQRFIIEYRMAKAADLLKLTSRSIAEIGAAVGYPNQLNFSRAFKDVYGVGPREWRKRSSRLV